MSGRGVSQGGRSPGADPSDHPLNQLIDMLMHDLTREHAIILLDVLDEIHRQIQPRNGLQAYIARLQEYLRTVRESLQ
jgi:hypothetical protein